MIVRKSSLILLFFLLGIIGTSFAQTPKKTRILFIFDASNSMNAPWMGSNRIEIARKVMTEALDSLKRVPNLELALRIYGHQTPLLPGQQDCDDTKLEVAFKTNNLVNIESIKNWIQYVVPKGTTPIARSLEKSGDDFPVDKDARNIIILVTDGIEACDQDPCAIAKALRGKGITVKPFVIGLGMNMDYLKALECIGNVYDANSPEAFKTIIDIVISEALNNTTAQINLNNINGDPTETDVSYTLYDQRTGVVKYNFVHTINQWGNPDTLSLDPLTTYRLVVHTIPQVEKKDIRLTPQVHNTIEVNTPRGWISTKIETYGAKNTKAVLCIIRKGGDMATINVQAFDDKQKYLVGTYDIEILCLPRIIMKDVKVTQSTITKIEIPLAGVLDLNTLQTGYGAIFLVEKGEMIWVCDLTEAKRQFIHLQPGKYKVVYRNKSAKKTLYTIDKSFTITSGKTISITI